MNSGRPTLGDVARIAGVHKATASRALNPATVGRVHDETARRVRAAAEQLGYRPNMNARGLRMRSSRTVGVIVPDLLSELYPPLVRGIEQVLRVADHFLLIADTERDDEQETRALDSLVSRQVDGLIAASSYTSHPTLQTIAATGTPVVLLDMTVRPDGLSTVGLDLAGGVDALTRLVTDAGHRSLAIVTGPEATDNPPLRADLHADALSRAGLSGAATLLEVAVDAFSVEAGYDAARRLFADRPDVTAVMAHNDTLAVGVIRAAHDAGLRVPEDVTVTGYNDVPLVRHLDPPLTTVRLDMADLGRQAAEVLLGLIDGSREPEHRTVPVTVVPRGSHGPVRA